jgi:hypothetical protein
MKRFAPIVPVLAPVLALALVLSAATARADDAEPEKKDKTADTTSDSAASPELRYPPPSTRFKLLATGLVLTGGAWGIVYGCAVEWPWVDPRLQPIVPTLQHPLILSGPPGSAGLKVPIVGPWIALGKSGCGSDQTTCSAQIGLRAVGYIVDGVAQLAGLGLIAEGIIMKTESPADADSKKLAFTLRYRGIEMMPVPMVTPSMSGVGLAGTF